jgi:hypothetical protein
MSADVEIEPFDDLCALGGECRPFPGAEHLRHSITFRANAGSVSALLSTNLR